MSVIPLKGKRPALKSWTEYQRRMPLEAEIGSVSNSVEIGKDVKTG
jgi:hypothetical protein